MRESCWPIEQLEVLLIASVSITGIFLFSFLNLIIFLAIERVLEKYGLN